MITRYEIEPAVGVKGAQIVNLAKDLARALSMVSIRVVETVPGKSCMALELPNPKRQMVRLSEIISSSAYHDMSPPLAMTLGRTSAASRWSSISPNAAPAGGRYDRFRQVGGHQRDDPVAALQVRPGQGAPDPGRPKMLNCRSTRAFRTCWRRSSST